MTMESTAIEEFSTRNKLTDSQVMTAPQVDDIFKQVEELAVHQWKNNKQVEELAVHQWKNNKQGGYDVDFSAGGVWKEIISATRSIHLKLDTREKALGK